MADEPHCQIFRNASAEKGEDDECLFGYSEGAVFSPVLVNGGANCREG